MRHLSSEDPAVTVLAWEAVEELLAPVPEGITKEVLRMVAAGFEPDEIGDRLHLPTGEVEALAARGRMRVLTAAVAASRLTP